jgi:hypothetical protein
VLIAALVMVTGQRAFADLDVGSARATSDPDPRVEVVVALARNAEPKTSYTLELGEAGQSQQALELEWRDPRKLQVVFVVDGSAAPPRLHALGEIERAITKIAITARGSARSSTFGVIVVDDKVQKEVPLGPELPGAALGGEAEHTIDKLDITAGLRAATDALTTASSANKRSVVVVIGMPREPPSRELVRRLRDANIEVFALELGEVSQRNVRALSDLVRTDHQFVASEVSRIGERADALGGALASVVHLTFPVPIELFDGTRHGITVAYREQRAVVNVDFPIAARPARRFPYLTTAIVASSALVLLGFVMLLRPRAVGPPPIVPTVALEPPAVVPAGPREPEESETFVQAAPHFAAWFYVQAGSRRGETVPIFRAGVTTIGRSNGGTHLNFDDAGVRRRHAKVVARGGRVVIVALPEGETVGVAGSNVARAELRDGAIVHLGSTTLLFKAVQ